jgi:hypothetical protein
MDTNDTYRARLRFRVQKRLNLEPEQHVLGVSDREVVLSPHLPERANRDSDWLVMNARGFSSEAGRGNLVTA